MSNEASWALLDATLSEHAGKDTDELAVIGVGVLNNGRDPYRTTIFGGALFGFLNSRGIVEPSAPRAGMANRWSTLFEADRLRERFAKLKGEGVAVNCVIFQFGDERRVWNLRALALEPVRTELRQRVRKRN